MEPMTLGSPSNSPAPEQYLPCFLLGDNSFSQTPRRNRLSPVQDRSLTFGNIKGPSSLSSSVNNEYDKQKNVSAIKFGPPIIDLFDDMPTTYKLPPDAFTPDSLLKREGASNHKDTNRSIYSPGNKFSVTSNHKDTNRSIYSPESNFSVISNQKDANRSMYSPECNSALNTSSMPYQFNLNNTSVAYKTPQFTNSQMSAAEVFNNSNNINSSAYGSKRPYPYNETTFQSTYDTSIGSNNLTYNSNSNYNSSRFIEQEFWVTIFGFMPEMHMEIASFFQSVGNFIDKYVKPDCNFLCLKYASRLEARQVLTYNGYLFKPGIIIGVMLCDNPELVGQDVSTIGNIDYESKAKLERLRHMSQTANRSPPIVQRAKKRKNDVGLIGKAIDYIMSW